MSAIESELIDRGYRLVARDSAQFLVHFHLGQRLIIDTLPPRDDPSGGGVRSPGSWGGYGRPEEIADREVVWEEGMLVVDALTPDGRTVSWRGLIAGEIPPDATRKPERAIREGVRLLFRGFP